MTGLSCPLGLWRLHAAVPHRGEGDARSLWLPDGGRLHLSPLQPGDAAAQQRFVRGLSAQSRYRRFHAGWPEVPPSLLHQMVDVDQQRHVALAARPWHDATIVADARFVRDAAGEDAEFAITVADAWQGRGLGAALLQRLAVRARAAGVRQLQGRVLAENRAMLRVVQRLGGHVQALHDEPGLVLACLDSADAAEALMLA